MKKVVILLGLSFVLGSEGMLVSVSLCKNHSRTFFSWLNPQKKENEELRKTIAAQSSRIDELHKIINQQATRLEDLTNKIASIEEHNKERIGNIHIRINELQMGINKSHEYFKILANKTSAFLNAVDELARFQNTNPRDKNMLESIEARAREDLENQQEEELAESNAYLKKIGQMLEQQNEIKIEQNEHLKEISWQVEDVKEQLEANQKQMNSELDDIYAILSRFNRNFCNTNFR